MDIKQFIATKAFIVNEGKVLVVRESGKYADGTNLGSYDVVGGRLTPGEHFKEALLREVTEETGLSVDISEPFWVGEWRPVVRDEQWQIVGIYFRCNLISGQVTLGSDHDDYKWIDPRNASQEMVIDNLKKVFGVYSQKY